MKPNYFRKKPVVIRALKFEYTTEGIQALKEFVGDSLGDIRKERHPGALAEAKISTLDDGISDQVEHIATEGDYIIEGVHGEFYTCKPDIFAKTYDEV